MYVFDRIGLSISSVCSLPQLTAFNNNYSNLYWLLSNATEHTPVSIWAILSKKSAKLYKQPNWKLHVWENIRLYLWYKSSPANLDECYSNFMCCLIYATYESFGSIMPKNSLFTVIWKSCLVYCCQHIMNRNVRGERSTSLCVGHTHTQTQTKKCD